VTDIAPPSSRITFVFVVLLVVGAVFASGLIGVGVGMLFATLTNQSKWLLGPLGAIVALFGASSSPHLVFSLNIRLCAIS
jgi:hypothetical protein